MNKKRRNQKEKREYRSIKELKRKVEGKLKIFSAEIRLAKSFYPDILKENNFKLLFVRHQKVLFLLHKIQGTNLISKKKRKQQSSSKEYQKNLILTANAI